MSSDLDMKDNQIPGKYEFISYVLDLTLKKTDDDLKKQGIPEDLKSIVKKRHKDTYCHCSFNEVKLIFKENLTEILSGFVNDILKELFEE